MAKKTYTLASLVATAGLVLVGCSDGAEDAANSASSVANGVENTADTVTIEDNEGTKEISLPVERPAIVDNRSFEILQDWGVEPVALAQGLVPATLEHYKTMDVADTGTHREPDLEALTAANPDVIISGQRYSQYNEDMEQLNPDAVLVDLEPRIAEVGRNGETVDNSQAKPLDEELIRQVTALGTIFGKEAEAQSLVDDFNEALGRARNAYDGEGSVVALNATGGDLNYVAPSVGRTLGPIFDMLELKPALEVDSATTNHRGDDISTEAIAQANPDFIMVLDRDSAVGNTDGSSATPAEQLIRDSAPLQNVTAVKDSHVFIAPDDTYVNENIITYTEILNGLADMFEAARAS